MDKKPTREVINLASKILEKTPYETQKEIIKKIFNRTEDTKEDIILRLMVIDSGYSTNLNRRLFGFEEISKFLVEITPHIELLLYEKINDLDFFKKLEKDLVKGYGISKIGKEGGHAFSLISKYIYFRSNFKFPIYDSLVRKGLAKLGKIGRYENHPSLKYFEELKKLREELKCTIDDLDKYFWILGKIGDVKQISPSLLISNKEIYREDFLKGMKGKKDLETFKIAKFSNPKLRLMQEFSRKVNND